MQSLQSMQSCCLNMEPLDARAAVPSFDAVFAPAKLKRRYKSSELPRPSPAKEILFLARWRKQRKRCGCAGQPCYRGAVADKDAHSVMFEFSVGHRFTHNDTCHILEVQVVNLRVLFRGLSTACGSLEVCLADHSTRGPCMLDVFQEQSLTLPVDVFLPSLRRHSSLRSCSRLLSYCSRTSEQLFWSSCGLAPQLSRLQSMHRMPCMQRLGSGRCCAASLLVGVSWSSAYPGWPPASGCLPVARQALVPARLYSMHRDKQRDAHDVPGSGKEWQATRIPDR